MTQRRRSVRLLVLLVSPVLTLLLLPLLPVGLRVNRTHSFPPGVYWVAPKAPRVGDLVTFEPPDTPPFQMALARGYIGKGGIRFYECMLKRLVAIGGDAVSIEDAGVTVNGRMLVNSKPMPVDAAGRPMPVVRLHDYRLAPSEVLLMSDYSPESFDGRYFGPIPRTQLQSVAWPVWTW
jgi:conjugative transfer signal peptidase TraF